LHSFLYCKAIFAVSGQSKSLGEPRFFMVAASRVNLEAAFIFSHLAKRMCAFEKAITETA
jgi:hypothetical protein